MENGPPRPLGTESHQALRSRVATALRIGKAFAWVVTTLLFVAMLFAPLVLPLVLPVDDETRDAQLLDPAPSGWMAVAAYGLALVVAWCAYRRLWNRPLFNYAVIFPFIFVGPSLMVMFSDTFWMPWITAQRLDTREVPVTVLRHRQFKSKKPGARGRFEAWLDVSHPLYTIATLRYLTGISHGPHADMYMKTRLLPPEIRAPGSIACVTVNTGRAGIRWVTFPAPCSTPAGTTPGAVTPLRSTQSVIPP